jgi:hypothetical protein
MSEYALWDRLNIPVRAFADTCLRFAENHTETHERAPALHALSRELEQLLPALKRSAYGSADLDARMDALLLACTSLSRVDSRDGWEVAYGPVQAAMLELRRPALDAGADDDAYQSANDLYELCNARRPDVIRSYDGFVSWVRKQGILERSPSARRLEFHALQTFAALDRIPPREKDVAPSKQRESKAVQKAEKRKAAIDSQREEQGRYNPS